MNWDELFIKLAMDISQKSKDRSTKVGAIIVGPDHEVRSMGFNGFPRGCNDDEDSRHERPVKYAWTEHAERNAIYNAARVGIPLKGCTLYMNWEPYPCTDCARAIIQSGIIEVVGPNIPFGGVSKDWEANFVITKEMFKEADIATRSLRTLSNPIPMPKLPDFGMY